MSLLQKSSLCRSWLAVGRTLGSLLVSFMMYLARIGHLWQNESGIFPSLRSPRVRTRSISVPKGWNSSRASTPMLYMSDWRSNNNAYIKFRLAAVKHVIIELMMMIYDKMLHFKMIQYSTNKPCATLKIKSELIIIKLL